MLKLKNLEYNEYVVGFVATFDDGRSINIQYEPYRNTNHPEPAVIAGIGLEGDETASNFTENERDWIVDNILNTTEIVQVGELLTKIEYSEEHKEKMGEIMSNGNGICLFEIEELAKKTAEK